MQSKEDLMKMFEMHLDGKTHAEIGRHFGVSRERVRQIVGNNSRLPGRPVSGHVYPSIAKWMFERSVSAAQMAEELDCMCYATLVSKLRGRYQFTLQEIKAILAYTGMTFETAFGEEIKPTEED